MKKYRLFVNVLKEEAWLNEMLAKGYTCTHVNLFGVYTFEQTTSKKIMRLDFRNYMKREKYEEYIAAHEDFGWNHIAGNRFCSMQYWQKEEDGYDEMFSDQLSQVAFYKRMSDYFLVFMLLFCIRTIDLVDDSVIHLFNPKASYVTAGLWEMEGTAFWSAFLFETLSAISRFLTPWMLIITAFGFFFTYTQYKKKKNELI